MNILKMLLCLMAIFPMFTSCDLEDKITAEEAKKAGLHLVELNNQGNGDWTLTGYNFHGDHGISCVWSKEFVGYKIPR
jgi:hypothetical protein